MSESSPSPRPSDSPRRTPTIQERRACSMLHRLPHAEVAGDGERRDQLRETYTGPVRVCSHPACSARPLGTTHDPSSKEGTDHRSARTSAWAHALRGSAPHGYNAVTLDGRGAEGRCRIWGSATPTS